MALNFVSYENLLKMSRNFYFFPFFNAVIKIHTWSFEFEDLLFFYPLTLLYVCSSLKLVSTLV